MSNLPEITNQIRISLTSHLFSSLSLSLYYVYNEVLRAIKEDVKQSRDVRKLLCLCMFLVIIDSNTIERSETRLATFVLSS